VGIIRGIGTPDPSQYHPLKAAIWMIGAIVAFSSMAVGGRSLSGELDTFEIMFYRSLIGFALVIAIASAGGTINQIRTDRLGLHFIRNLCHFFGQNLWFFAIATIPLAQVFALEFSSPLWVTLAAPLFLGERLTATKLFCALVGFGGIMVVARPDLSSLDPGLIAAALAAIGFAGSAIFTKMLTRDQSITCILFWLTGMQFVFGLVTAAGDGDLALPSAPLWPWVVLVAIAGLVGHLCLTKALTLAPATMVMPFDFLRLPVIAIIGMLAYGEPLNIYVLIGAAIIFGANYLNIWTDTKSRRK